jgi:hypothetical protein
MRKVVGVALALLLFVAQPALATCPDGTVGPVCMGDSGTSMVNHINNALNGTTQINPSLGQTTAFQANIGAIFYPDAYGASGSTATGTCTTSASSNVLTNCSNISSFAVGHGVMEPGAGAAIPWTAPTSVSASWNGGGSGSFSYAYLVCGGDPLGGMICAASASSTLSSKPAISPLTYYPTITFTQGNGGYESEILYVSVNAGAWTLVHADVGSPQYDGGERPSDGRGWPITISGPGYTQKENFFSTITAINGNAITTADNASSAVSGGTLQHDDTIASQSAESAAETAGGGVVLWGPHTYNIWRPQFWTGSAWTWAASAESAAANGGAGKIVVEHDGITFAGSGPAAKLSERPDQFYLGGIFNIGAERARPWTATSYAMSTVNQGDQRIALSTAGNTSHFSVNDDVWLYFGSQTSSACTMPANCAFSEVNSITSIDSVNGYLYLKYPAVTKYYNDGTNAFGVMDIPRSASAGALRGFHDITIKDLTLDVEDVWGSGGADIIGVTISNVESLTGTSADWWWGGLNRQWKVLNSKLAIGDGDIFSHSGAEWDEWSDVLMQGNTIVTYSPSSSPLNVGYVPEGISLTEGSSNYNIVNNQLRNTKIGADCASNNLTIVGNVLQNGEIAVGNLAGDGCGAASFGVPNGLSIANNTINTAVLPNHATIEVREPTIGSSVTGNTLVTSGAQGSLIKVSSGTVSGNTLSSNSSTNYPICLEVTPSTVSVQPITVANNTCLAQNQGQGIQVDDPGSSWAGLIQILGNTESVNNGTCDYVVSPTHTPLGSVVRLMGESVGGGCSPLFNPTYLADVAQSVSQTIYSVAGTAVPSCSSALAHQTICVSDSTACTSGTTYAGSSSTKCKLQCNGTNWLETGGGCF